MNGRRARLLVVAWLASCSREAEVGTAFEWPDGVRRERPVEVTVRAPAYVTGRKE